MARSQAAGQKMSREEAGRLGGRATSKNHDRSFYQMIGKKVEKRPPMLMIPILQGDWPQRWRSNLRNAYQRILS